MLESSRSGGNGGPELVNSPIRVRKPKRLSRDRAKKMKGEELTERQQRTLDVIRRHIRIRGIPPSRSELARELGMRHQASVDLQLSALARKNWVKILPNVDRGIQLLREGAPLLDPDQLPEVAAGAPIVAEERPLPRLNDFDSFAGQFESRPDLFLRVQGDSLDRVGIQHRRRRRREANAPEANDGDLVVARIGQEIVREAVPATKQRRSSNSSPRAPTRTTSRSGSTGRPRTSRSWGLSSGRSSGPGARATEHMVWSSRHSRTDGRSLAYEVTFVFLTQTPPRVAANVIDRLGYSGHGGRSGIHVHAAAEGACAVRINRAAGAPATCSRRLATMRLRAVADGESATSAKHMKLRVK